ncbi:MAG: peptidoglycan-binding protein [Alphaproteobacteria bacterium]|nr:peptidoglycan-binding protein [Alphaproteobacteria bacterium]
MIQLPNDILSRIAPRVAGKKADNQAGIIREVSGVLAVTLAQFEIDSVLRIAHFLAQVCHESDGFCTTIEYASGNEYDDRRDLGNTQPGDGRRYKGRGLIQLTGRDNYQHYGNLLQLNLIGDPDLASEPATSLKIACEFWRQHNLNNFADQNDIERITRRINGGLNGLDSRRTYLARAKAALAAGGTGAVAAPERSTIRLGNDGEYVAALQSILAAKGFAVPTDGHFDVATATAVAQFQESHGLQADGIVGPRTWQALR